MKKPYLKPGLLRLSRELTGVYSPVVEVAARNRRRSERVLLQIPIVFEIPQPDSRGLRGDAYTLCVSAHGGLMEMGARVECGQQIILTNPGTDARQFCRVVRCERNSNGYYAVSFEFLSPAPSFWPLVFPPTDWKSFEA